MSGLRRVRALLWASLAAALVGPAFADDAAPPKVIATRQTLFSIPFTVDRPSDPARRPQAVALYVSLDQGGTWRFHSRAEPDRGSFLFRAGGDGMYWFAIRTLDAQGRVTPEGGLKCGLRVLVDTVPPQLRLEARRGLSGEIVARWQVDDEHFDPASLRLQYRTPSQADWETVAVDPRHTRKSAGRFYGEVAWAPKNVAAAIEVRAEVADAAKNLAVSHAQLPPASSRANGAADNAAGNSPRDPNAAKTGGTRNPAAGVAAKTDPQMRESTANRTSPTADKADPFYPSERASGEAAAPAIAPASDSTPARGSGGPQLFSPATGPRGPSIGGDLSRPRESTAAPSASISLPGSGPQLGPSGGPAGAGRGGNGWRTSRGTQPADPAPAIEPADLAASAALAAGGARASDGAPSAVHAPVGAAGGATSTFGTPVVPSAPALKPADGTVTIAIHPPVGSRFDASPIPAGAPKSATFRSNNGSAGGDVSVANTMREGSLPATVAARMVASQQFELEYEVDSVGPSGIAQVELWGTRDGGRTWTSFGVDADKQSPFLVSVPEEGLYGFRFAVRSGAGLGGDAPAPGTQPDLWVGVDLSKPKVRILAADQGTGPQADQLTIRWEVEDWALVPRCVSIQFAESREGPWSTVATGQEQSGQYVWKLDNRVPERFHLRIEARDEAGNLGIAETYEPVVIDRRQPQVRIRDVRGR